MTTPNDVSHYSITDQQAQGSPVIMIPLKASTATDKPIEGIPALTTTEYKPQEQGSDKPLKEKDEKELPVDTLKTLGFVPKIRRGILFQNVKAQGMKDHQKQENPLTNWV
jgi:hypothetical protein